MIKLQKQSELTSDGAFVLIYGPTWVGKTYSSLKSLLEYTRKKKGKLLFVAGEPRGDNAAYVKAIGFKDAEMDYLAYSDDVTGDEIIEFLSDSEECKPYSAILYDGLSFTMGFTLQDEVTKQAHAARDDSNVKVLGSKVKMTKEGHGIVNNVVKRILKALGNRAGEGKVVVVTALDDTQFKWGDRYLGGPALTGKEVPRLLPPLFDYIGMVSSRTKKDGDGGVIKDARGYPETDYPPIVQWESPDGSFLAKGGGVGLLDFNRMLEAKKKKGK